MVNSCKGFSIDNNHGLEVKEHRNDTSAKSWHPRAGTLQVPIAAIPYRPFANRIRLWSLGGDLPLLAERTDHSKRRASLTDNVVRTTFLTDRVKRAV